MDNQQNSRERDYFVLYKKYKTKYLQLKKIRQHNIHIGGNIELTLINKENPSQIIVLTENTIEKLVFVLQNSGDPQMAEIIGNAFTMYKNMSDKFSGRANQITQGIGLFAKGITALTGKEMPSFDKIPISNEKFVKIYNIVSQL